MYHITVFLPTEIINEHRERYFEAKSHKEKREYTIGIVESIRKNGRFLKRDKHTWKEASFETARQKVAHAMQYRQRCLMSAAPDFNEESMNDKMNDDGKSTASSVKDDVQTSDGEADNIYATIDSGLRTKVPTTIGSRKVDSYFWNQEQILGNATDGLQTLDGASENVYAVSSIDAGVLSRVATSDMSIYAQSNIGSRTAPTTATYPAQLRVVSDIVRLYEPNSSLDQQYRSTFDSKFICSQENIKLSDLVFMPSQSSQPSSTTMEKHEALLPKSSDEHSTDAPIPPPFQSLLRGTSDFSFGDFSLDGEFMSSVEDGDHEHI